MEMKAGWSARVLAGSDKGKEFAIKKDFGSYVLLIDSKGCELRKNKKHIQVIKKVRDDVTL